MTSVPPAIGRGVRALGLQRERLVERARGEHVHATKIRSAASVFPAHERLSSSRWTTRARSSRTGGSSSRTASSSAVGDGAEPEADESVDLGGAVVTPGLVNTHHHLYQTLTRARAPEGTLFEWLVELYPMWARIDAEAEYAAARTGLAELALSGCTHRLRSPLRLPHGEQG